MTQSMRIRGVLFDLDNTLVDRQASLAVLASEFADVYAGDLEEVDVEALAQAILEADGGGYRAKDAVFERLLEASPWAQKPAAEDLQDFWYATFPRCTRPMPGVYEVLEALELRGLKMGVVTNGSEAMQNAKVDRLDLRVYMETVIVSEAVGAAKPDAKVFGLALEGLGLAASGVCFVGDHPDNDVAGAAAAGLTPIWLDGHHPWPEGRDLPVYRIHALEDLPPLIEQISQG